MPDRCREYPAVLNRSHPSFQTAIRPATNSGRSRFRFRLTRGAPRVRQESDLFRRKLQVRFHVRGIQEQAEAQVVVAVRRVVPVTVRRPAIRGMVVPAAAPVDPVRALYDHPPRSFLAQPGDTANFLPQPLL